MVNTHTHTHIHTHKVSLTSSNCNNRTRVQERERGTAVSNSDLQRQVATPRQEACRNRGISINGQGRRKNGKGVARGTVWDNKRCNNSVEEVDEIEVDSHKRKRRDSVSPLSRLIRSCRRSSNH